MPWLLALAACTIAPVDTDPETVDTDPTDTDASDTDASDDPCQAPPTREQAAYLCMPWGYFGAYDKTTATGHFEAWGSWDEVRFVEDDGASWEVWLWGSRDAYAAWPAIADDEHVTITQVGGCDPMSGPYNAVRIDDDAGEPILLQGARADAVLGDWRIHSPEPAERCPRRTSDVCFETVYNRQVTFEHADESWTLWHGESVSAGALDLRVNLASGNEDRTTDVTCSEIQGGDTYHWIATRR